MRPAPERTSRRKKIQKTITNWQIDKWKKQQGDTHHTRGIRTTPHTHFDRQLERVCAPPPPPFAFPLPYRFAKVVNALTHSSTHSYTPSLSHSLSPKYHMLSQAQDVEYAACKQCEHISRDRLLRCLLSERAMSLCLPIVRCMQAVHAQCERKTALQSAQ